MLNTFDKPEVSMNYVLVDEGVPLVVGNIVLEIQRKTLEKPEIYFGLETEVRISEQIPVGESTGVDVPGTALEALSHGEGFNRSQISILL